jgi:prolyl-tRNA synthetase
LKTSQLFFPTLREVPSEAETVSHQLLLRAGFIRKSGGGVYSYLPLAWRVLQKIEAVIREEMNRAGGQEINMPIIQPRELWDTSGRWSLYGEEMFKLKDRHGRDFALGPTHEELITTLVDGEVHSYRALPLLLYQIQNKYRDEIRPRFGLMRGREFIMKDLYSFDVDEAGLDVSYQKMYQAYQAIFDRLQLNYRIVEADSGAIGGNASHEFMVLADSGESEIAHCEHCGYAANVEKAVCVDIASQALPADMEALIKVHTPGVRTVEELAASQGIPADRQMKTLIYLADGAMVAVVLRGDRELNEIKLRHILQCTDLQMADEARTQAIMGTGFGSLGIVRNPLPLYADYEVKYLVNSSCGANETDYHYLNVNVSRDATIDRFYDLHDICAGDPCPVCRQPVQVMRGIEAGHIFKLGVKYSAALGAAFLDPNGRSKPFVMGCYGIGVSRTMAAAVEQNYDADGIIWPMAIAPFQTVIILVNGLTPEQTDWAHGVYAALRGRGVEVLLDDRDERPGVKFKDADLIGIPLRLTVGPKALKQGQVELKYRKTAESILCPQDEVIERVTAMIRQQQES